MMYWLNPLKNGGMESGDEKKKLNEDLVRFIRKRSDTDAPRYTARLKTYVDIQQKRRRAAAARRHTDYNDQVLRRKCELDPNDKNDPNCETEKSLVRGHSGSRSRSREPADKCGGRRRRRRRRSGCRSKSRRRKGRSCGRSRRRRRRGSCGRKKRRGSRRRRSRKRSCGRRKRSCGRRKRSCGRRGRSSRRRRRGRCG